MDNKYISRRSQPFQLTRFAPILIVLLALSRVSTGDDEIIGTFRGVPISGDVIWEKEQVDQIPTELLWVRMSISVCRAEIERLDIEVSEDELSAENEKIRRESGFTIEKATEMANMMSAYKKALTAWLASPENDSEIYKRILAPVGISKEQWGLLKQHHGTPEKVAELRVPDGPEEIFEAGVGNLREELLHKKLAEHILGRSITNKGPRWDAYLKSRSIEPNSKKAGEARYFFIRNEVSLLLRDWVAQLIVEKQLTIENDAFKAALEAHAESIVERKGKNEGADKGDSSNPL